MKRILLLGCPIDTHDMNETIAEVEKYIVSKKPCRHVVVNVAKLVTANRSPEFLEILSTCEIINPDGMPIVWAAKILGLDLRSRVAGIDLFYNLISLCASKGYRPFFLGARKEVVSKVVSIFTQQYPNLKVAGFRDGYFSASEEKLVAEEIRESNADMIFVAIPSPKKEEFINRWNSEIKVPFCMGVGGSFDVVAGVTMRAPLWMQNYGLEWFFRLIQEPRKMWKRYATTNPIFIWMVVKEYLRLKMSKGPNNKVES